MTEISFAPKEVIGPRVCRLEVLAADKAETYGLQISLKLRVIGGEYEGHTFTDYANRDEDTGQIKQGSKAWTIFEACLGRDFHKRPGIALNSLVGKQFIAQVVQTKTGSRNKVEFGTIGPFSSEEKDTSPIPAGGDDNDFKNMPF